jgi:hypothetical protein
MAFKSYEELIKMASNNPRMARKRVTQAQKDDNPVVSSDNSGYEDYRSKALQKRLSKTPVGQRKNPRSERLNSAVQSRIKRMYKDNSTHKAESKIITPKLQDEIVTKRKKVGY